MNDFRTPTNYGLTLALLIAFSVSVFTHQYWVASSAFGLLAAMFAVLANLDRLKKFKFGWSGFEADVQQAVRQARDTMAEIHTMAETVVSVC